VRLPELLYLTVRMLDECHRGRLPDDETDRRRVLEAVAGALSEETGRELAAGHVEFLLDRKLAPLGVTTYSDGSPPEVVKARPFLALTCKMTVLSERATWFLAGLFTWLFSPPALACAITAILSAEIWVFGTQPVAAAVQWTLRSPSSILLVVLLAVASTAFHEIGHGTACRYGGARPGVTGCGLYLAWPVFFTDITSSYRLSRGGRLRADLGGVYFNGIFILALTALYLATGSFLLLAAILSSSLEAVQQMLPTLRFDGYYIVADMVGIPDLFKYIGPILRRVLLRRPDDGRLAALRRRPQAIITIWVLLVVPVLIGQLALLAYNFPVIARSDWTGIRSLAASSVGGGDPVLGVASAAVQILLLLFPLAGVTLIGFRTLRGVARLTLRRLRAAGTRCAPR
jgi:putative peptide zinc metalloprotease protein